MNWRHRCAENRDKATFIGVGKYGIPPMQPVQIKESAEMVGFNFAASHPEPEKVGVHFFLDDYQFQRVWDKPERYMAMLRKFKCVCTPDFSMFTDYPLAVQLYNHYRKHWLGAWWQMNDMLVIPSVSWSDESSYEWCFDGDPIGGTVAISSVGTQMDKNSRMLFQAGYEEMMRRLMPTGILFHGDIPKWCTGNIMPIKAYQRNLRRIKPVDGSDSNAVCT